MPFPARRDDPNLHSRHRTAVLALTTALLLATGVQDAAAKKSKGIVAATINGKHRRWAGKKVGVMVEGDSVTVIAVIRRFTHLNQFIPGLSLFCAFDLTGPFPVTPQFPQACVVAYTETHFSRHPDNKRWSGSNGDHAAEVTFDSRVGNRLTGRIRLSKSRTVRSRSTWATDPGSAGSARVGGAAAFTRVRKELSMRSRSSRSLGVAAFVLLGHFASLPAVAYEAPSDVSIASRTAEIDGVRLHYLAAGSQGIPLILLHGYAETSRMWKPVIPVFAKRFIVVAPDLPGIGDSGIPESGLDVKTAAVRIHALARSLGFERAEVVGHDIGLMVAYAYAALFPEEVEKLVVMDAFLPGIAGWEAIYNDPGLWHFRFNGATPEALVRGRERTYFEHFWNDFAADRNHSLPEADRRAYASAYARQGRMRAGWAYFVAFPETAKEFAELSRTKLTMPILAIGGEKSLGEALGRQMESVGTDVTIVVLKDTGHWVLEERPQETTAALRKFL
jgi:pimeloyl-ACP methyl ester carboxylesterase